MNSKKIIVSFLIIISGVSFFGIARGLRNPQPYEGGRSVTYLAAPIKAVAQTEGWQCEIVVEVTVEANPADIARIERELADIRANASAALAVGASKITLGPNFDPRSDDSHRTSVMLRGALPPAPRGAAYQNYSVGWIELLKPRVPGRSA